MKGKIGKDGDLQIGRKGKLARVYCPYVHAPIGYTEKPCGDWCPLFGEPEEVEVNATPRHHDLTNSVYYVPVFEKRICLPLCKRELIFTEFTDERVTNDDPQ